MKKRRVKKQLREIKIKNEWKKWARERERREEREIRDGKIERGRKKGENVNDHDDDGVRWWLKF
jgi:hypothetical protein